MKAEFKYSKEGEQTVELVQDWADRIPRLRAMVAFTAARTAEMEIRSAVPSDKALASYRRTIELAEIIGLPPGESGYAVHVPFKRISVGEVDKSKTVLYVRPRRKTGKVPPEVRILECYSPWTVDTLPFVPRQSDALVVSRQVNEREVTKIAKDRKKDRPRWRAELMRVGGREEKKSARMAATKKMKAVPDTAFEALRLEFGLGGTKAKPHWRPALQKVRAGVPGLASRMKSLTDTMTTLSYRGWMHWPPEVAKKIREIDAREYVPFQEKLGVV